MAKKRNRPARPKPPKQADGPSRAEFEASRRSRRRRLGGAVFGGLLIVLFVFVAIAQGIGNPSPSGEEAAVVEEAPDGTILQEEIDAELERTPDTARLEPGSAEYEQAVQQVFDDLILTRWFNGEAEDLGIEVSDREIDQELDVRIEQQLGGQQGYEEFLEQQNFTEDDVRERIRLELLSQRIQDELVPSSSSVDEEQVEAVYEQNVDQFSTPESRNVRLILTPEEAQAEAAFAELAEDNSAAAWERVAREFSTDEATKNSGGLREGVVEGQSEAALDDAIFSARQGELTGPVETESGFYVLEVEEIVPAETVPLSDVEADLRTSLETAKRDQLTQIAVTDFFNKWQARTFCAEDVAVPRCANYEQPNAALEACTPEVAAEQGCDAPVPGIIPQPPQRFEVDDSDPAAALTQPPTPAFEAELATLSQTFVPGLAQGPYRPAPEADPATQGIPPELQQQLQQQGGAPVPPPTGGAAPAAPQGAATP